MAMELLAARDLGEFYGPRRRRAVVPPAFGGGGDGGCPGSPLSTPFSTGSTRVPVTPARSAGGLGRGLVERFGGDVDWSGLDDARANAWHRQLHIFLYPFYYIEYGIAQLGALHVWRRSFTRQAGRRPRLPAGLDAWRLAAVARAVFGRRRALLVRRRGRRPARGGARDRACPARRLRRGPAPGSGPSGGSRRSLAKRSPRLIGLTSRASGARALTALKREGSLVPVVTATRVASPASRTLRRTAVPSPSGSIRSSTTQQGGGSSARKASARVEAGRDVPTLAGEDGLERRGGSRGRLPQAAASAGRRPRKG